jgi:hypothetical protein
MSRKKARQAKREAEQARDVRRAGMAALLAFGALMVLGLFGGALILRGRGHQHGHGPVGHDEEILVDLENTRCPTCGEEAAAAGPTVDWHHLRVHLSRAECEAGLTRNAEKVLDASEIDWRPAALAARDINHLSGQARSDALAKAEARWHIVSPVGH